MRFLFVLILATLLSFCSVDEGNTRAGVDGTLNHLAALPDSLPGAFTPYRYDFDTTLSGGYTLVYKEDDSLEYLYLKKDSIIAELTSCSRGMLHKSLGYIGADFPEHFALAHSFGFGNPHYFELIEKRSGREILSGTLVDVKEEQGILLYTSETTDSISSQDTMILYDINTRRRNVLEIPDDLGGLGVVWMSTHIDTVTDNELVISYYAGVDSRKNHVYKKRVYRR